MIHTQRPIDPPLNVIDLSFEPSLLHVSFIQPFYIDGLGQVLCTIWRFCPIEGGDIDIGGHNYDCIDEE